MLKKNVKTTVAIVGVGYIGFPTAIAMAKAGARVIGIDISRDRVRAINRGKSIMKEIPDEELHAVSKRFTATTDWKKVRPCSVILIAVPTPLTKNKTPDTTAIERAGAKIAKFMRRGTLVILESTSYPGTTEEVLQPILEKGGLVAGKDFYLAFASERFDPGNKEYRLTDIPKVVGGINRTSTEKATAFYKRFYHQVHPVSSPRNAEMAKLLENIFRLVNISLVNELKMIADKMGVDFWEAIEAAKTKPYGFMPFYPGPGVGGHCIPLDPFFLAWKAREHNFFMRFIHLAGEINELMPHYVVTRIATELNRKRKSINGSTILLLGAAYKKDIDDHRESPALDIMWDLTRKGGNVLYNDPHIPTLRIKDTTFTSASLTSDLVKKTDCVVILTDHSAYDYRMIAKHAKLVIDTRNAIKQKLPTVFA